MKGCGHSVASSSYVIFCLIWVFGTLNAASQYTERTKLLEDLQKGYRTEVLPKKTQHSYVAVKIHPTIVRIEGLDAEKEELSSTISLTMKWVDERLWWNPSNYGEVAKIRIPASQVWLPDIAIHNTIYPPGTDTTGEQLIEVSNLGEVLYVKQIQARSYCHMDFTWFPRDQHTCRIIFSSWVYTVEDILMQFFIESENGVVDVPVLADSDSNIPNLDSHRWQLKSRKGNAKINLVTYSCCPDEAYAQLNITVTITRSAEMLIYLFTVPMLVISALVPFQFVLSCSSSHRQIYGILLVFGEMLPLLILSYYIPDYAYIPFIGIVNLVCLVSATCALILSVIMSSFVERGSSSVFDLNNPFYCANCSTYTTETAERYEKNLKKNNIQQENRLVTVNHSSEIESNNLTESETIPLVNIQRNGSINESGTHSRINSDIDQSTLANILQELRLLQCLIKRHNEKKKVPQWVSFVDKVLFHVFLVLFAIEVLVLFCGLYFSY